MTQLLLTCNFSIAIMWWFLKVKVTDLNRNFLQMLPMIYNNVLPVKNLMSVFSFAEGFTVFSLHVKLYHSLYCDILFPTAWKTVLTVTVSAKDSISHIHSVFTDAHISSGILNKLTHKSRYFFIYFKLISMILSNF